MNWLHVDNKARGPDLVIQGQGWDVPDLARPAMARPAMGNGSNSLTQSLTLLSVTAFSQAGCAGGQKSHPEGPWRPHI